MAFGVDTLQNWSPPVAALEERPLSWAGLDPAQLVHAASDPRRQGFEAAGAPGARRERRATIGDARLPIDVLAATTGAQARSTAWVALAPQNLYGRHRASGEAV
jgi:hypothetical protein